VEKRKDRKIGSFGGAAARGVAAVTLLLSLLASGFSPLEASQEQGNKFSVGDTAPDFTLEDLEGKEVSLSDFAGEKVVLLNFFSLRCGTCLMEAPYLEEFHRRYAGRGVVVMAVSIDGVSADETAFTMRDVKFDVTYPVLVDPEFAVTDIYTNFLVPLTIVIDRAGTIRYIHGGFKKGDEEQYEEAVRRALGS